MTKIEKAKPLLQTASLPAGKMGGMIVDPTAKLTGPRTGMGHEFETRLAADTEAAKAKRAAVGWRKLPSGISIPGDRILTTCSRCRRWDWLEPGHETGDCTCYHLQGSDAGVLRPATADEEKAWFKREQERRDRFIAGAPARKAAVDAANRRRNEDTPDRGEDHSRGRG
ncbi:MAG: hypothetical protein NTV79_04360 [Candidatus Aureabacteria bacterium]|nr:hypothetical protein [Candidatus Auribacterota bacterium]